jgi:hypothetical protein
MLFALCISWRRLQIGNRFAEIRKKFGVRRSPALHKASGGGRLEEKKKKKEERRIMRDGESGCLQIKNT